MCNNKTLNQHTPEWEAHCVKVRKELDNFLKLSDSEKFTYFMERCPNNWGYDDTESANLTINIDKDNYKDNFFSDAINIPPQKLNIDSVRTIRHNHAEICPVCKGKGYVEEVVNNLRDSTVPPSYYSYTCIGCHGTGWVIVPEDVCLSVR